MIRSIYWEEIVRVIRRACFYVTFEMENNLIFDLNSSYNYDNHLYSFHTLKLEFLRNGFDLSTQDINSVTESQIVIYNEMPQILPQGKDIEKSYLLIFESELIRSDNWDLEKHKYFNKIFTWNDDFVDNKKYIKMNFAQKIPISFDLQVKEKLLTLVAGNKKCDHYNELYSERLKAIKWFEKYHPQDFDLYGIGWNRFFFKKPLTFFNRFQFIEKIAAKRFPSYKGVIQSKKDTICKYKFAICFENAKNISGYITEKIFDCFFAGCVPIYWGAPNITNYIPKECFIDRRNFASNEELYCYIKRMDDYTYDSYLNAVERYVNGEAIKLFSADTFAISITKEIFKNLL